MVRLAVILSILCGLATFSRAAEVDLAKEYALPEKFTLYLPGAWVQIPKKVINENKILLGKPVTKATIKAAPYSYGFQSTQTKWFSYPSLFIQIQKKGKYTQKALKEMSASKKSGLSLDDRVRNVINLKSKGQSVYEPNQSIVWSSFTMVSESGPVSGLVATKLTSEGYIRLFFYASENEYKKNAPLFEAIARKVTVDPSIQHKPS